MMITEIKLIALDLDGTLLDSQKRLSCRNKRALEACIRQGIEVVPCTGRIWSGIPKEIRDLPGIRYAITTNGAVIQDVQRNAILDEQKLNCSLALEILKLAREFRTMYDAYVDGLAFGEARFIEHMEDYGIPPAIQRLIRDTRQTVPDVAAKVQHLGKSVEKINYFFGDQKERVRARNALEARGDVVISSSFPYNLEINAQGATKGEAILRLAAHLGFAPEQTMGIGDGENDITMVRLAGVGVAMGNAESLLKAEADYVTDTNDRDGVAAAIERLIFPVDKTSASIGGEQ